MLVAAVLSLVAVPAEAGVAVPVLRWGPCDGDVPAVYQCATAKVPMDYARPHGRKVELALIRQPATDTEHKIGSLFLAHPMGMFDFVASAPPGAFAAFGKFDVISYDGRGAARAEPAIDCGIDRSLLTPFGTRQTRPGRIDVPAMVRAARQYGEQCEQAAGELLPHMSTAVMARDLDLLRRAVGDEKLSYVGISQGTVIGATYAAMFPGRVRAMVFDATVDSSVWMNDPLRAFDDQDRSTEDVIRRFLRACAAAADACRFGGGRPAAAFDKLVRYLDKHPQPSPDPADPFPVDGDDVRVATNEASYSPSFWAPLAEALADAEHGDYTKLRAAARHGYTPDGTINDPVNPAYNLWRANVTADGRFPHDIGTYLSYGRRRAQQHPRLGAGYSLMIEGLWPSKPAEVYRGPFRNSSANGPVLVIGGTHDPATPYSWSKTMTNRLGNARLLTYDSDGHGALNDFDPCVLGPVLALLDDGHTLPPAGTVCTQDFDPFGG